MTKQNNIKTWGRMSQHQFSKFLHDWDNASKQGRADILRNVITQLNGKIATDIEDFFCNCASLFFTRMTAWLRLSYMATEYLEVQLETCLLFVSATNGHKFLLEFIEVGGILTLLEVVGLERVRQIEKKLALEILSSIGNSGRKYKELICESFGIRAIAECLANSNDIECQTACRKILKELSTGNPKFENQLYKSMIALLKCSSPEAQRISAQLLQYIQPSIETASISIIDPCLLLLRTLHLEVLFEACELIKMLVKYGNIGDDILSGLVGLLRPLKVDMEQLPEIVKDSDVPELQAPLPVYLQQAAAAKIIGLLLDECEEEFMDSFLNYGVVQNLMFAMSNEVHVDSQKQAGVTLHKFICANTEVEKKVRDAMGQAFFFQYMNSPDSFFMNWTSIHRDILAGNNVTISGKNKDAEKTSSSSSVQ